MKRKKLVVIGILVVIIFSILGYKNFKPSPKTVITEEMRIEREFQRKLCAAWYDNHQKNVSELDRNFRSLNDIMEGIREGNLTPEEADERLLILEENAKNTLANIRNNIPDTRVADDYYDILVAIREKTIRYAEAAYHVIGKIRVENENHATYEILDNIRVRNMPVGLFVANEVIRLRESLEVKEE